MHATTTSSSDGQTYDIASSTHGARKCLVPALHVFAGVVLRVDVACSVVCFASTFIHIHCIMDSIPNNQFYTPPSVSLVPSLSKSSAPRQMLFGSHDSPSIIAHYVLRVYVYMHK